MVTLYATNSTNDLAHCGRPRDTTARQDMYIRRQHINNRFTRATIDNWQPPISDDIVRRHKMSLSDRWTYPYSSKLASLAVDEYHSPNILQFHRRYQKQRRNER